MNKPQQPAMPARSAFDRRQVVKDILTRLPDALVVSGLGSPSYDVYAAGDRPGNFYLWGAMGGSTSVALGLALAQPDKIVLAITGDGEQLMGIGSLATVAVQQPANLALIVLDNGHFGETGMQRSHASLGANLTDMARACGIRNSMSLTASEGLDALFSSIEARSGTTFAQLHIEAHEHVRALPPRDGVFIQNRFRSHLGLDPF
ncbi:MAG: thiamine pyrophosphate-dependent enzyme [Burkholderiaceae bacterium]